MWCLGYKALSLGSELLIGEGLLSNSLPFSLLALPSGLREGIRDKAVFFHERLVGWGHLSLPAPFLCKIPSVKAASDPQPLP